MSRTEWNMMLAAYVADLHQPRRIPDDVWEQLLAKAAEKDAVSDRVDWTRRWRPGFNLVGEVGEEQFRAISGMERNAGFGDGGRDFGDIDVKASGFWPAPSIAIPIGNPLRAGFYALVAVDLDGQRARYWGWAYREEVAAAPERDLGNGPNRMLGDLYLGFPVLFPGGIDPLTLLHWADWNGGDC